jgi:hypothetical protein
VKFITKLGDPVYHQLTFTDICTSQTVNPVLAGSYTFSATPNKVEKLTSATKPVDDFTNSDETNCPYYWKIVKSDGTDLDGGLESILSIDANGYVEVDTSTYTGGTIDAKV